MSDPLPNSLECCSRRGAIAAAFAGKPHSLHQTPEQMRARNAALTNERFPLLVDIMPAAKGVIVAKPGTRVQCWLPYSEIRGLYTAEYFGELREDAPNGRGTIRYHIKRFDVTPVGKQILQRNGLLSE